MTIRLVDTGWSREVGDAATHAGTLLRIICPFIKTSALRRLLIASPKRIEVITRFNLADFAEGVSDTEALSTLTAAGACIRGVKNLHSKLYLFGTSSAIVTSANLTEAALTRNHEFGLVTGDETVVAACHRYFEDLWVRSGNDLTPGQLADWNARVAHHLANGGGSMRIDRLPDMGVDAGVVPAPPVDLPPPIADARQGFVKFLGEGHRRASLHRQTTEEIASSGCNWALAYPATKRPRRVQDGAVMFIARLTSDPQDIRVFGRAIGMAHVDGRDDATESEIAALAWKANWPRYVRVHHAEFIAGTMSNGVSLNELMDSLGQDAFASTQRNAAAGRGNLNPRDAYRQQAAVELSTVGLSWLAERFQNMIEMHGAVPVNTLHLLDRETRGAKRA